jgi:tetratricopeptide (TPR) repeat protein
VWRIFCLAAQKNANFRRRKGIVMNPQELEATYKKAVGFHQSGNLAQAESLYARLLKEVPQSEAGNSNMAALQYSKGNLEAALRFAERALVANPFNLDALINKGSTLMAMGRNDEAIESLQLSVQVNAQNPLAHYNLAHLYYLSRDLVQSEAHYRKAIALKPDFFHALFNLGNVLTELGRREEAKSCFHKTILANPGHLKAYSNLALLLAGEGDHEAAFKQLELALEVDRKEIIIWTTLSQLQAEIGLDHDALDSADAAIALNRDSLEAWIYRGNALRNLYRSEEASEAYQVALALQPDHIGALRNLRRLSAAMIPGWHFQMLADTARNAAFDAAIRRAVRPGDHVLDIGTGSGLLAMMAARAGASLVIGCEANPDIAEAAVDIVRLNGYNEVIEVVDRHSGQLKVGVDLPRKVDVIVAEILDAGLTGEGCVPSLRNALRTLAKPNARVVPASATACVQCWNLPNQLTQGKLQNVEGFDLSPFERFRIPKEYEVSNLGSGNGVPKSEVLKIKQIDFRKLGFAITEEDPERFQVQFEHVEPGDIHALGLWFLMELDAEAVLSSGPNGELRHWGQAVFFFEETVHADANGRLLVQGAFSDMMWRFWVE